MATEHDTLTSEHRVLLIDLDNCPNQLEQLPHTVEHYTRVIVCYGGAEPKVPLNFVTFLAQAMNSGRLDIVGMEKPGKNAADFGLTFWAGRLMAELPADTEFIIVSNDNHLNHAVNLLRSAQRKVLRLGGTSPLHCGVGGQNSLKEAMSAPIFEDIEEFFYRNVHPKNGRPRSKKTLRNSIKAYFKKRKSVDPDTILQGLIDREFISIGSQGKVVYLDTDGEPEEHILVDDDDDEIPF